MCHLHLWEIWKEDREDWKDCLELGPKLIQVIFLHRIIYPLEALLDVSGVELFLFPLSQTPGIFFAYDFDMSKAHSLLVRGF